MGRSFADEVEAERKQDIAWRLSLAGATVHEIAASKDPDRADNLFQDARGAAQALRAARRRHDADEAEALEPGNSTDAKIKSDIATFRRLKRALWPAATAGDVAAIREIRQLTMASATLEGYVKGQNADNAPVAGDPVDELTKRRDERRATGS